MNVSDKASELRKAVASLFEFIDEFDQAYPACRMDAEKRRVAKAVSAISSLLEAREKAEPVAHIDMSGKIARLKWGEPNNVESIKLFDWPEPSDKSDLSCEYQIIYQIDLASYNSEFIGDNDNSGWIDVDRAAYISSFCDKRILYQKTEPPTTPTCVKQAPVVDERVEFESSITKFADRCDYRFMDHLLKMDLGHYSTAWVDSAWIGWQARAKLGQAAVPDENMLNVVSIEIEGAMRKAFNYGQSYWQQADSEYISQQNKSDETLKKFKEFTLNTQSTIAAMLKGER